MDVNLTSQKIGYTSRTERDQIFSRIPKNTKILRLSNNGLRYMDVSELNQRIRELPKEIVELHLDDNELGLLKYDDFNSIVHTIGDSMPVLQKLNLSRNDLYCYSADKLNQALHNLPKTLQVLILSANNLVLSIESSLAQFISSLVNKLSISVVDISGNGLDHTGQDEEVGLKASFSNMLERIIFSDSLFMTKSGFVNNPSKNSLFNNAKDEVGGTPSDPPIVHRNSLI